MKQSFVVEAMARRRPVLAKAKDARSREKLRRLDELLTTIEQTDGNSIGRILYWRRTLALEIDRTRTEFLDEAGNERKPKGPPRKNRGNRG